MANIIQFSVTKTAHYAAKVWAAFGGKNPKIIAQISKMGEGRYYIRYDFKTFAGCPREGQCLTTFCTDICHAYAAKTKARFFKKIEGLNEKK